MNVKVATFNLNNLFSRYNFNAEVEIVSQGDIQLDSQTTIRFAEPISYLFRSYEGRLVTGKDPAGRQKIAARITAMNADVLAVQEVEDVGVLHEFALNDLGGMYPHQVLVEGNDPRLIDVGLLSKLPIGGVTSWKYATHSDAPHELVFGRDLLEVEILDPQRRRRLFTIYNNHLKSNYARWDMDPEVARRKNGQRRQRQAETVARIVEAQMRPDSSYVIVGDMNDTPDSQFLEPLITASGLGLQNALLGAAETRPAKRESPPEDTPANPVWTYRHREAGVSTFALYDQIWVSPALADKITGAWIDRRTLHSGDGSDHDPAWIQLSL